MRILIDTNILFSAVLNSNGIPRKAFNKAVSIPNIRIVSYQSLEELVTSFSTKLPTKTHLLESFLVAMLTSIELVTAPKDKLDSEDNIRDIDDRTIYRAAVKAKADIILTGDNDLLESGITSPQIMTAREFIHLLPTKHLRYNLLMYLPHDMKKFPLAFLPAPLHSILFFLSQHHPQNPL